MTNKPTIICGDTHGEWETLFRKIDHNQISDCILIHVGDIGIGFVSPEKQKRQIELLNNRFKQRSINFVGIRGNHDDPAYFGGDVSLSNFELLPDYTYREINDELFLFVGGAVSVDRINRIMGQSWWEGEPFKLEEQKIKKCDTLITHTAPTWIGPMDKEGIQYYCDRDPTLWDECLQERKDVTRLLDLAQPNKHYCGHFHMWRQVEHKGCTSEILDIFDLKEHRSK